MTGSPPKREDLRPKMCFCVKTQKYLDIFIKICIFIKRPLQISWGISSWRSCCCWIRVRYEDTGSALARPFWVTNSLSGQSRITMRTQPDLDSLWLLGCWSCIDLPVYLFNEESMQFYLSYGNQYSGKLSHLVYIYILRLNMKLLC